jgi:hypothetical protein
MMLWAIVWPLGLAKIKQAVGNDVRLAESAGKVARSLGVQLCTLGGALIVVSRWTGLSTEGWGLAVVLVVTFYLGIGGILMLLRSRSLLKTVASTKVVPPAPPYDKRDFEKKVYPFSYYERPGDASLCLTVGQYKDDLFQTRADEGFCGNGYDWESLARVFLSRQKPELEASIDFDSEAGMFCALSKEPEALRLFALSFKHACEDDALITDLFAEAILD